MKVTLILGRPFLAIYQALIDVSNGRIMLRVGDEEIVFKLPKAIRHSLDHNKTYLSFDVIDGIISECLQDSIVTYWMSVSKR